MITITIDKTSPNTFQTYFHQRVVHTICQAVFGKDLNKVSILWVCRSQTSPEVCLCTGYPNINTLIYLNTQVCFSSLAHPRLHYLWCRKWQGRNLRHIDLISGKGDKMYPNPALMQDRERKLQCQKLERDINSTTCNSNYNNIYNFIVLKL